MKIAIIGFGLEGQAAYDYWQAGNEITICDLNLNLQAPEAAAVQLGEDYLAGLDQFDLVVRSPNPLPAQIIAANGEAVLEKITSNTNEFLRVCPTKNIIGVTGTKGKGTTSTLTAKMLEAAGKRVHLGGNIGIPALELLKADIQPEDWVVLELSSFQLIDLQHSPHIAVCLMVVPEHLDWHEDVEEYIAAKQQLFVHQAETDIAIYYTGASPGKQIPYFAPPGASVIDGAISIGGQAICQTAELKLLGAHNWQNVCAAVTAVWQATQDIDALRSVLTSFSGLPHRIEFLGTVDSVNYYNDSFASGLAATEAAVMSVHEKKVLIVGGYDRMLPLERFANFANLSADTFRTMLIIGASGARLAKAFDEAGFTNYLLDSESKTMEQVVAHARKLAQPGDAILLSPGFASFDMFKNFEDRGLQFKAAVNSL
jgi:UDP-N-acetylmuramoylalanine--D-glutamate ligase